MNWLVDLYVVPGPFTIYGTNARIKHKLNYALCRNLISGENTLLLLKEKRPETVQPI
jgi:hypothetical protein